MPIVIEISSVVTDALAGLKQVGDAGKTFSQKLGDASSVVNKNFKMMEKGVGIVANNIAQAFDLAAKEAERLGRSEVTDSINEMNESFKDVLDTLVQIPIGGRDFLGWMGDAAEGATNLAKTVQIITIAFRQQTGSMTDAEASAAAAALAHDKLSASEQATYDAQIALAASTEDIRTQHDTAADAVAALARAEREAKEAADEANSIYRDAQMALENSNVPLFEKLDLLKELAIATGETTAQEQANQEAIAFLTKQLELGKISLDEWKASVDNLASGASNANAIVNSLSAAISSIPRANFGAEPGGSAPVNYGPGDNGGATYGGAQAAGGSYMVSRPTWFLAGEAGPEQATFTPVGKSSNINSSQAVTFNISHPDADYIVSQVSRVLAAQARQYKAAGAGAALGSR